MKKYVYNGEIEGAVAGVGILKRGDVVTAVSEEQEQLIEASGLFEEAAEKLVSAATVQAAPLPVASVEGVTQNAEIKVPEVADPATADPGAVAHTMPVHVAQLVSDFAQEAVQGQQVNTTSPAPAAETGTKESEA